MSYYCTPADMIRYFGSMEIAQRSANELQPQVSGDLFEATIYSQDRSGWTVDERDNADTALIRLNQVILDASDFVAGYLRVSTEMDVLEQDIPHSVRRATADVARYELYDDGCPPEIVKAYDYRLAWLSRVASGTMQVTEIPSTAGSMMQWRLLRS